MSDLTDRLREFGDGPLVLHALLREAADEIDRQRVRCKMLQDDKAALMEQLTLAESVRAAQVAGVVETADKLRADNADLQNRVVMPLRERVAGLESQLEAVLKWQQEGGALFNRGESVPVWFHLGAWWADRPWRDVPRVGP
jgi:hypothetical protein